MCDTPPINWPILAVCIYDEFIHTWISMLYHSNNPIRMGPYTSVDELLPHSYVSWVLQICYDSCLNGTVGRYWIPNEKVIIPV